MKHKHYDMIVAWAEGKIIQFRMNGKDEWTSLGRTPFPGFIDEMEYRLQPDPKKYRVWESKAGCIYATNNICDAKKQEQNSHFQRWVTDWEEYK